MLLNANKTHSIVSEETHALNNRTRLQLRRSGVGSIQRARSRTLKMTLVIGNRQFTYSYLLKNCHVDVAISSQECVYSLTMSKMVKLVENVLHKQYEVFLSQMLHDILGHGHIHLQWHLPLIRLFHLIVVLLPNWTFLPTCTLLPNSRGSFNIKATGAASKQRTLTPPGIRSHLAFWTCICSMCKFFFPELVMFPDFGVSNIPTYF